MELNIQKPLFSSRSKNNPVQGIYAIKHEEITERSKRVFERMGETAILS